MKDVFHGMDTLCVANRQCQGKYPLDLILCGSNRGVPKGVYTPKLLMPNMLLM